MNESIVEFKKTDGNPIKFNFQLPNGFPVKTILNPPFDIFKSKKDESFFIHITLSTDNLNLIKDLSIKDLFLEDERNLWIILNNEYIVLNELPDIIINSVKNKNIYIGFLDTSKKIINQFQIL
mgnify:FL=1